MCVARNMAWNGRITSSPQALVVYARSGHSDGNSAFETGGVQASDEPKRGVGRQHVALASNGFDHEGMLLDAYWIASDKFSKGSGSLESAEA